VAAIEVAAAAASQEQQQQAQRQRQQQGRLVVLDTGMRRRVPPSATTAYMTQSVMPQHANTLGITFGGQVRLQSGCNHAGHHFRGQCLLFQIGRFRFAY
jgi:hypothetical protein